MKPHIAATATMLACAIAFSTGTAAAAGEASIPLAPGAHAVNVHDPFDYFVNSFTVVGLKDHPSGTRITPRGELVLGGGAVLTPLVGPTLAPLRPGIKAVLLKGWLPVVKRELIVNGTVRIALEAFACPITHDRAAFDRPRGDDFLTMVRVALAGATGESVEGVAGFERRPEGPLALRPGAEGSLLLYGGDDLIGGVRVPERGRAEVEGSRLVLRAKLAGSEEVRFDLAFPFLSGGAASSDLLQAVKELDAHMVSTAAFWEGLIGRGAALAVPEDKVRETYLASLAYQFIGRDRGEVRAGEGFYDEMYLRDGAYQALSLAHAGYIDEARESVDHLLRFAKPDGQLVSQRGQLDANGYGMWAPVELAQLSGDVEWLRRAYPCIRAAARWAMKARRDEKDASSPFFGVLPAAPADGENLWAGKNHIVGYDWWNLRGIGCVAKAARMLGEEAEAREFEKEFEDYRAAILKALERTGLGYIPPSYEKAGTHWGNLEVVFPTPLLPPQHPLVGATLRHVRTEFGSEAGPKGFVEGTIQWTPGTGAIHPYMSQFVTNTHIARGEESEAVDGLYALLLHTTSTHGFPEGVYWRKREAWGGTVPHLWAAALYVTTLRNMLVREDEDAGGGILHLLSAVPDHWLDAGKNVGISGAPTRYGKVSFRVEAAAGELVLDVRRAPGGPPARVELHLPPSLLVRGAVQDGAPAAHGDHVVRLGGAFEEGGEPVRISIERRPPEKAVTFASAVAAYEAAAVDFNRPIPGVLPAPPAVTSEQDCIELDLSNVATTNPFDGPFLVSPAAAFTGLAAGDLKAGGIPFRTVDPATNGGKGLVVLAGAQACKNLPVEAEIPANGARGKYLAVLGGVTGWAPGDPGVGEWGAVAECVVRYAGGSRSVLPWIPGRTADDWLAEPHATDVAAVLQGSRWHLNVLVLALEPKPIEAVVIRDLGTPSAPVVAAITIVR